MDEYENYQFEVEQEIIHEAFEYSTNCQRSEDEGWFYPDYDSDEDSE